MRVLILVWCGQVHTATSRLYYTCQWVTIVTIEISSKSIDDIFSVKTGILVFHVHLIFCQLKPEKSHFHIWSNMLLKNMYVHDSDFLHINFVHIVSCV